MHISPAHSMPHVKSSNKLTLYVSCAKEIWTVGLKSDGDEGPKVAM